MLELWLDNRERGLCERLCVHPFVVCKSLALGDAVLVDAEQQPLVVFERKTESDLAQSIKDGRYAEQKARLHALQHVVYIFESCAAARATGEGNLHGLSAKAFHTCFLSTLFHPEQRCVFTENLDDTAALLLRTRSYFANTPRSTGEKKQEDFLCVKRSTCITPHNIFKLQLCQVPGVSVKTAEAISHAFQNHASAFYAKYHSGESMVEFLASLPVHAKKIGRARAIKICEFLCTGSPIKMEGNA